MLAEAVRLADPTGEWAALRADAGDALAAARARRHKALAAYRAEVDRSDARLDADLVIESLLHTHHIRAAGIAKDDERRCLRLARAAALAWAAREKAGGPR